MARKSTKTYHLFIFSDGSTFLTAVPLTKEQAQNQSLQGEVGLKIVKAVVV